MPNTMTRIATTTLTQSAANIVFQSINTTYTDLLLRISARSDNAGLLNDGFMAFNTGGSYARRFVETTNGVNIVGNSAADNAWIYMSGNTAPSNTFGNCEVYIINYRGNKFKTVLSMGAAGNTAAAGFANLLSGNWDSTAAIDTITLTPRSANFMAGTIVDLYGIKNT